MTRPTPRLFAALHRAAFPAATAAMILANYRAGSETPICRDVIRAAFQNRHLTRDWKPWPDRGRAAVDVGALYAALSGARPARPDAKPGAPINGFHVDDMDAPERLYVDVPDRAMTVAIAKTDEGLAVDIFSLSVRDEPLASAYAFTTEATAEGEDTAGSSPIAGQPSPITDPNKESLAK